MSEETMPTAELKYPCARRIVAKVGSATLMDGQGNLDEAYFADLAAQIAELAGKGVQVVLVSSGAIAAAIKPLGFSSRPRDLPTLQALASVGQSHVMEAYRKAFAPHGIEVGQILLTRNDTGSRSAYLNARQTVDRLLALGCVPVVNENDTVAVDEIKFGDNDSLAAIVGALVGADLVVLMSDVDGFYTGDPRHDPEARMLPEIGAVDDDVLGRAGSAGSGVGTGGMATKVRAASVLQRAGIPMSICEGRTPHVLADVALGYGIGSRFLADPAVAHDSSRKQWIGFAGHDEGALIIDDGARDALHGSGGSLLPVGVTAVEGTWARGAIVAVKDSAGVLVARGICRYSNQEADLTRGMKLQMVARVVPDLADTELIHRDEMLVF